MKNNNILRISQPIQLAYVVASGTTANILLKGQLSFLRKQGYEITVIASPGPLLREIAEREDVNVVPIPISRSISPFRDLLSLFRLWKYLRKKKPQIVNASTPKAGLLGMVASYFCRIPIRIYTLRGLRLETTRGVRRKILSVCERIASRCSHRVICVSHSLAQIYGDENYTAPEKITVLGCGSSNGVNTEIFSLAPSQKTDPISLRNKLHIPNTATVLGFVGRLTRDKGIAELIEIFEQLQQKFQEIHLILIGDFENEDAVDLKTLSSIKRNPNIHVTGFVEDIAKCYHSLDLLVFPSFREGFPNVALEAQASGLPVVGYAATGTVDAVLTGKTGVLVPIGDTRGLQSAIATYLDDDDLRRRHGRVARERVLKFFQCNTVWKMLDSLYRNELINNGVKKPKHLLEKTSTATSRKEAA